MTWAWNQQDKHEALNFQLITDLLRVAREEVQINFQPKSEPGRRAQRPQQSQSLRWDGVQCSQGPGREMVVNGLVCTRAGEKCQQDMMGHLKDALIILAPAWSVSCSTSYNLILYAQKVWMKVEQHALK